MHLYVLALQASPFSNPMESIINLMVLTVGGPTLTIFRFSNEGNAERDALPFPEVAYFIWVIFIIVMATFFVNFLVSYRHND